MPVVVHRVLLVVQSCMLIEQWVLLVLTGWYTLGIVAGYLVYTGVVAGWLVYIEYCYCRLVCVYTKYCCCRLVVVHWSD